MFGNKKDVQSKNVGNIDTLLGSSCSITGDILTKSSIKIDGAITGNVTADGTIIIAEKGNIKGDVKCKELIVFGAIEGSITSHSLHLQPTSHINGQINTKTLNVEVGAVYQGAVNMQDSASDIKPDNKSDKVTKDTVANTANPEKIKL